MMYSFHQFKTLPIERQVEQLTHQAIALDLAYAANNSEAVLFADHDFYIEMVVEKFTDEILSVNCFKSLKKLESYLPQVDISEITTLLYS